MAAQDRERTFAHDRAEMHRIDDLDIRVFLDQAQDGVHDVLHGLAVVLPPVAGHKDDLPARVVQLVEQFCRKAIVLAYRCFQGIDDRIARDEKALGHALFE